MPVKSKIRVREIIPTAFAASMKEVAALIAAGDSTTTIESDDLIQIDGVCGGLYSLAEQRFGFCFYDGDYDAGEGVDEGGVIEWCYDLSKEEIAGIAVGTISQFDMWRCAERDCGRRWSRSDGYCPRCDFQP